MQTEVGRHPPELLPHPERPMRTLWKRLTTRYEGVAILAADARNLLRRLVVGLDVSITKRPVSEGASVGDRRRPERLRTAPVGEMVGMPPPEHCTVVQRRSS